jgi:ParB family chromosome partitioning protein
MSKTMPKAMSKTSLGKGLGALIPAGAPGTLLKGAGGGATEVELHRIIASDYQPRKNFKDDAIASLAESIKSVGVIQPVILRRREEGGYQLIAGERRFRAAALAGLTKIPAIVKDVSPAEVLEMALVENIQREDLNPIETAEAYERLVGEFKLTQEELSAKVGKERSTVANFLRLLTLPPEVKRDLAEGALSMGHAKAILSLDAASKQMALRREIISRGLSVREAEGAARKLRAPGRIVKVKEAGLSAQMEMLEDELKKKFGTKVKIKRKGKRGSINIEFYSDAELDRLLEFLRG